MIKLFRIIKNVLIFIGLILVLGEVYLFASNQTFINRVIAGTILRGEMSPDIDELNEFPRREIYTKDAALWPKSTNYSKQLNSSEQALMDQYQTVSFVVIRHDSLCFEHYQEPFDEHSFINSFSMAKSFTSALIGVALKRGLIHSIDQPVSDFIDAFKQGDRKHITIRHLLTMSSGLGFNEDYASPFSWPSEAYYGEDVNGLTLKAEPVEKPGQIWVYKGGDTQLLGIILQRASGMSVSQFAARYFWPFLHPEHAAYWSLDRAEGMEKVSCCWYSTARDFARIARLYMHYGNWDGVQLIDSAYIVASLQAAPLHKPNGSISNQYGFQWWILPNYSTPVFYCRGIRGQYIFALPEKDAIIVRLGHRRAKEKDAEDIPKDIYAYLDLGLTKIKQ